MKQKSRSILEVILHQFRRDSNNGFQDAIRNIETASALRDETDVLVEKYPTCEALLLDVVERPDKLDNAVNDLVVSLLPYSLHPLVLKHCKKNMLTVSYCTPDMRKMHEEAFSAGITVVNEVGLDPGIDHLLALECIHEAERSGGKVESFISFCGGLPSPEFPDNPLRYKFSWSPRGVLLNTRAAAKYLQDGRVIDIPAGGSLLEETKPFDFLHGLSLEGIPIRNSTIYQDLYGLHDAKTVLRGTLRYRGFSNVVLGLLNIDLLTEEPHPSLHGSGPDITWHITIQL